MFGDKLVLGDGVYTTTPTEPGQEPAEEVNVRRDPDGCRHAVIVRRKGRGPAQVATKSYRDNWQRIFGATDPYDGGEPTVH